jgi:hypothetical protein
VSLLQCQIHTHTCQRVTFGCGSHAQRVKSHSGCGNRTLRVEINLVCVEITLARVVITLVRFVITLRVEITLVSVIFTCIRL